MLTTSHAFTAYPIDIIYILTVCLCAMTLSYYYALQALSHFPFVYWMVASRVARTLPYHEEYGFKTLLRQFLLSMDLKCFWVATMKAIEWALYKFLNEWKNELNKSITTHHNCSAQMSDTWSLDNDTWQMHNDNDVGGRTFNSNNSNLTEHIWTHDQW